jgi:micrococcal nuclease
MSYGPYHFAVDHVHDGDTVMGLVDLGFGLKLALACRIYGINAPELATQAGKDALAFAQTLVKPGDDCIVTSYGWDKYGGRFDGTLLTAVQRQDFGQQMLASGHAVVMK